MSRSLFTYSTDFSVQANFSAIAGGLHAGILARGWLQTADTGQSVPSTVTVPSGSSFATGYTMYKTNDGVGTQFFLKVRFGRHDSVRKFKAEFTLGTGSDGSGGLTGNVGPSVAVSTFNGADPGLVQHRALTSGDAGRLTWSSTIDAGTASGVYVSFMVIARTVDSSQAQNSNGMEMFWGGSITHGTNGASQYFLPAPSYSTILDGVVDCRGYIPHRESNTTYLGSYNRVGTNGKVFFSHPVNFHEVASQYQNPNVLIGASSSGLYWGLTPGGIYKVTSAGITREYLIMSFVLDNGIGGPSSWSPRID